MATHDYVIANGTGAAVRSDLNGSLAAIVSNNSSTTAPTTTYAYMWWADTTTGLLKQRNAANNAWITIGTLASTNLGLATLASPTFTGTPAAPTATAGTNTTQLATTAYVVDQALAKAGGTMTGVITYAAAQPRLVRGTAVTSTSGTSIDFTGIPSWAKKITVIFYAVSTTGVSPVQIQLGDSGGVETTGYLGSATVITGTNACLIASYTPGFLIPGALSGSTRSGLLTIANVATTVWVASGAFDEASAVQAGTTQGYKILSDVLDRVRITTGGGTDTFDSGIINIIYEG